MAHSLHIKSLLILSEDSIIFLFIRSKLLTRQVQMKQIIS